MDNKTDEKKSSSILANIIGASILIVFIGSVAGMIYFKDKNPMMIAFLFGLLFFWVGTGIIVTNGINKDVLLPLLFSFVGATVMTLSGMYMWGSEKIKSNIMQALPFLLIAAFIIAGIVMILAAYIGHRAKMRCCTEIVTAVCVKLNESYSRDQDGTTLLYAPVYNFYYDGQEYTVEENTYTNVGVPKIGSEVELHINPEVPEEFYSPSASSRLFSYIFGGIFVIMPAICLVLYIKQMK